MKFDQKIHTERLSLRSLRWRDFGFFYALMRNRRVRQYLGGPVIWSQRIPRFIRYRAAPNDVGVWVVSLVERSQPIGIVELGPHKDGKDYEISYQFHPTFWGQGLAREAIQAVVKSALNETGLVRIIAETQSANSASCRLLSELGMLEVERIQRFGAEQIIFTTS
ncbi:hypothetical protein OA90_04480 [Labrenzia sp. OB1]|nr:hypothetical protein OA90_04480 [Labrenzia sp. OB1]